MNRVYVADEIREGLSAEVLAAGTKAEVRLEGAGVWGEIERVQCLVGGGTGSMTTEDYVMLSSLDVILKAVDL